MVNISKVEKLFTHKIISIKWETNSNSLGLVSRERPPYVSCVTIAPFIALNLTPQNRGQAVYLNPREYQTI